MSPPAHRRVCFIIALPFLALGAVFDWLAHVMYAASDRIRRDEPRAEC